MIEESRRRTYLHAMQVTTWLPRCELPFAAPSRPTLRVALAPADEPLPEPVTEVAVSAPAAAEPVAGATAPALAPVTSLVERLRQEPGGRKAATAPVEEPAPDAPVEVPATTELPPRFTLQLARAGDCLLLVELPTGEAFQRRDPAYLLLRDLLRAANLPDSPHWIGEPIRWPAFAGGAFDQGPDAARDYVQAVVSTHLGEQPSASLWLVGVPASRFAGDLVDARVGQELHVEGLGNAWCLPDLETLMEQPALKAELWRAMRRVMRRWSSSRP